VRATSEVSLGRKLKTGCLSDLDDPSCVEYILGKGSHLLGSENNYLEK
jgi:hypothetical protein